MGTSYIPCGEIYHFWDHPHAYGDKCCRGAHGRLFEGSSPRVWGQGVAPLGNVHTTGIIPTRMGTRQLLIRRPRHIQDHPHAYGDKFSDFALFRDVIGSSPRVWGQGSAPFKYMIDNRIIPTRMGTSPPRLHSLLH